MHSNYSGYGGWNPGFVPNPPRFRFPRPPFRRPRFIPANFYSQGNNPHCETEWDDSTRPWLKRIRLEAEGEINQVPKWAVLGVVQKDQILQTDEDEVLKELRRNSLEEQIQELKRGRDANPTEQGTQTDAELEVLEANSRLLEQKLEEARKQETKMQQEIEQLGKKHKYSVIRAQMKETTFKDQIKQSEAQNSDLKEENETLKTEAGGDRTKLQPQIEQLGKKHKFYVIRAQMKETAFKEQIKKAEELNSALKEENETLKDRMFSEVRKLEHSHLEKMEREQNKWKTEMEMQIQSLKDEHDAVHFLITEEMKTEISEAEKIIKGLKEDKKTLRRTKTNSGLLERKLRHEIHDLKTQAQKEKRAYREKLERRAEEVKNAEKCIREIRTNNGRLKAAIKSSYQSDGRKKIEDLEEKLKRAETANHRLASELEQLRQNGGCLAAEITKVEQEMSTVEASRLAAKVAELESELSKTQESLALMTQSRDAAVQGGIQLQLEQSRKLNQMQMEGKEREEHAKLLLSGMTPNQFVAKHQQLIDQQRLTKEKLEKSEELVKSLRIKNDQLKKRAAQRQETNTKLAELQTEKEALSKELQDTVDRLKKETDQTKKLKSELSRSQISLKEKTSALEQLQKKEVRNSQLKKKCDKLEKEKTEEKQNLQKKLKSFELEAEELRKQMADLVADVEPKMQLLADRNKELKEVKHKLTLTKKKHYPKWKPTHEESSQTDPSVQMNQMDVDFFNFLNAKDQQIVAVNDKLAKVRQQLEELRGAK